MSCLHSQHSCPASNVLSFAIPCGDGGFSKATTEPLLFQYETSSQCFKGLTSSVTIRGGASRVQLDHGDTDLTNELTDWCIKSWVDSWEVMETVRWGPSWVLRKWVNEGMPCSCFLSLLFSLLPGHHVISGTFSPPCPSTMMFFIDLKPVESSNSRPKYLKPWAKISVSAFLPISIRHLSQWWKVWHWTRKKYVILSCYKVFSFALCTLSSPRRS